VRGACVLGDGGGWAQLARARPPMTLIILVANLVHSPDCQSCNGGVHCCGTRAGSALDLEFRGSSGWRCTARERVHWQFTFHSLPAARAGALRATGTRRTRVCGGCVARHAAQHGFTDLTWQNAGMGLLQTAGCVALPLPGRPPLIVGLGGTWLGGAWLGGLVVQYLGGFAVWQVGRGAASVRCCALQSRALCGRQTLCFCLTCMIRGSAARCCT
jgi:hypothetical protein